MDDRVMTIDKKDLAAYRLIVREIQDMEREKDNILTEVFSAPAERGMPCSGGVSDAVSNAAVKRQQLQSIIDGKIDDLISLRRRIESAIAELPPADRLLLRYRYIDGMNWDDVARNMHYSYQHTHRMHGWALQRLRERQK